MFHLCVYLLKINIKIQSQLLMMIPPQTIQSIISQIGAETVLTYIPKQAIHQYTRKHNLHSFLLSVPSAQLQRACTEKQQLQDQQFRNRRNLSRDRNLDRRYNVLNFTITELVNHCWNARIIDFNHYINRTYEFRNHYELGMRLVERLPQEYYVGQRSEHFNLSQEIEDMYGINRNEEQVDADSVEKEQEQQGSDINDIIDDNEQQSNYSINSEQQLQMNYDQQQSEQQNGNKKKRGKSKVKRISGGISESKKKKIKKQVKQENCGRRLRKLVEAENEEEGIFYGDYEIEDRNKEEENSFGNGNRTKLVDRTSVVGGASKDQKERSINQKEEKNHTTIPKKMILDSDQQ